jgi:UDP-GlcNAc3NAcA epimerase
VKLVSIVGARPQFIKLAPLARRLEGRHEHVVVHTGQHYDRDMSKSFFDELDIREPDFNLAIGSGSHGHQTGRMLVALDSLLADVAPDAVLVYGDTNSTLAGALAAIKVHVPVAHVEAGYRSYDISMPEEVNRIVADRICQLRLAPTEDAVKNLLDEDCDPDSVVLVGNIMAESLLANRERIQARRVLEELALEPLGYVALTMHRPENTEHPERLAAMFEGFAGCPLPIVFPVHPRSRAAVEALDPDLLRAADLRLIGPLGYLDFSRLLADSRFVMTDSGGVQEEAILGGVPCLTLRYNTERVATMAVGANVLVGARADRIREGIAHWMKMPARPGFESPPMWDTGVSERIVTALEERAGLLSVRAPESLS